MNQLLNKTLSQIVSEKHQTASIFEKYHLDYCCKGKRSLKQACDENHIPLNEVVEALQNIYAMKTHELDFEKMKLSELVDYIVYTHHSYIKKEMPQILSYLEKVSSKHGSLHNELYNISELFVDLSNEMTHYMHKEETILFPMIKQLDKNSFEPIPFYLLTSEYLKLPIIQVEQDHEDAGNKMAKIGKLTNNYTPPPDSCNTFKLLYGSLKRFEVDLHHHVHLENSILFPKALVLEKELRIPSLN